MNILDRANVGFARLAMQDDLGLSKAEVVLGFGMFYIGYIRRAGRRCGAAHRPTATAPPAQA